MFIERDEGGYKNFGIFFKKLFNYIKLVIFDGSVLWLDYKLYFEVCVVLNGWIDREKGFYLVVFLRGNV